MGPRVDGRAGRRSETGGRGGRLGAAGSRVSLLWKTGDLRSGTPGEMAKLRGGARMNVRIEVVVAPPGFSPGVVNDPIAASPSNNKLLVTLLADPKF